MSDVVYVLMSVRGEWEKGITTLKSCCSMEKQHANRTLNSTASLSCVYLFQSLFFFNAIISKKESEGERAVGVLLVRQQTTGLQLRILICLHYLQTSMAIS